MSGLEMKNPIHSVLMTFLKNRFCSLGHMERKIGRTTKLYFLLESVRWLSGYALKICWFMDALIDVY